MLEINNMKKNYKIDIKVNLLSLIKECVSGYMLGLLIGGTLLFLIFILPALIGLFLKG